MSERLARSCHWGTQKVPHFLLTFCSGRFGRSRFLKPLSFVEAHQWIVSTVDGNPYEPNQYNGPWDKDLFFQQALIKNITPQLSQLQKIHPTGSESTLSGQLPWRSSSPDLFQWLVRITPIYKPWSSAISKGSHNPRSLGDNKHHGWLNHWNIQPWELIWTKWWTTLRWWVPCCLRCWQVPKS